MRFLLTTSLFVLLFTSGCNTVDEGEDSSGPGYNVPAEYVFTDAEGNSTVNFNGQAQRLEMMEEMSLYMKSANTPGVSLTSELLKDMYANSGVSWTDMSELGMTGSSKQLKNKTAASSGIADPAIQAVFEGWMDQIAALSAITSAGMTEGGPGVGGVVLSTTNNNKQYLQSAQGLEYVQLIEKGLMGAVFYNQISMVYLGDGKMDVDNTAAVDAENGKFYTAMEHHWDEAYGYFTTATDYPNSGTDRFWGKYAAGREELLGSASTIARAFRLGRAAIANNDLNTRDTQIAIIRESLEQVCGATAIHYLNSTLSNLTDHALRNHALSEAYAFIGALPYGYDTSVTATTVNSLLETLGDDFYNVSPADLIAVRDQLAQLLNLEDVKEIL